MGLQDEFSLGFSHILPITLRSTSFLFNLVFVLNLFALRILLATIKYLGGCPCPRCTIAKEKIPQMGGKLDMRNRQNPINIRADSSKLQRLIAMARGWIFELGYRITGAQVERVLKPASLVPTRVSPILSYIQPALIHFRMRLQNSFLMDWTTFRCSFRTSCTSLSLGCGNQSSRI